MLKIGLTGGIGSGKSTIARYFSTLKVPVFDADEVVHTLFVPNTIIYKKIVAHFGKNFLTPKKSLDRKKISELIFHNKKERLWLEKLLHPRVRIEMMKLISSLKTPYCVMVIPLLFETKFPPKIDRVLVVDCSKKIQIKRIRERNHYTTNQAKIIIATQISRSERLKRADDIISNQGTLNELRKEIKKLHNKFILLT